MTRGARALRRGFALLAVTGLVMVSATAAQAREKATNATTSTSAAPGSSTLPVGLSLVSQSTWVPLHDVFQMTLHIDNPDLAARPGAAIALRVRQSATSRSGFDDVIANRNLGGTLYVPDQISLASLTPDKHRNVTVRFGLTGSPVRPRLGITRHGVYPVEVQLVNTGVASASFVTFLVVVDPGSAPIDKPLSVAFVWQVVADPMVLPDGSNDPHVVAEIKQGGRLDRIATLLAQTGGMRYSLVLGPETAQAWKKLAQQPHAKAVASSFARVRAAALRSSTEVLSAPFVPIDAAALDAAGLGSYLPAQYLLGASALRSALGATPSPPAQSAFIDPAPTDDAVVDGFRQQLIDRIAVREQALIPVTHPFSPAQAFDLETTGGGSRAIATAPFVENLVNGSDPSALRAERVVAALAEIAYETPSIARGIVLAPPARWKPDVKTMGTIVAALRSLPLVQTATLDDVFGSISTEQALGTDVQRRLVPAVPSDMPVNADEYRTTADELSAYRDVVGARDKVVVDGEAALNTVLSTSIPADRAHTELAKIDTAVHAFTSGIRADEKRITLTSRRARVPLTFENNLKPARDVTVRVHLESAKLVFPEGADQSKVLKPGSTTIRFSVEARASGTFPMTIRVTSADGRLAFGDPVRVTVRSAVFGGWAVGVTVAALVFLAGWWANHFRRARRNRRRASQPAPASTS